jgi:hypothetical protein
VHDESWWTTYAGHIEANWESAGLRRYSTLDRDAITALVLDPAWSNEGLFALLQGLRRLAEISGDRTEKGDPGGIQREVVATQRPHRLRASPRAGGNSMLGPYPRGRVPRRPGHALDRPRPARRPGRRD